MNYCTDCGCKINKDDKYCEGCGKPLQKTKSLYCVNCGSKLNPRNGVCMHCLMEK